MPDTEDAATPLTPPAEGPPGMPRWVQTGAVVLGVLILLFLLLHVTGAVSGHGPGQHL